MGVLGNRVRCAGGGRVGRAVADLDLGGMEDPPRRVIAGRHGEERHVFGIDNDRLAGGGVEHVGEHLLQFIDVGPVDEVAARGRVDPGSRRLVGVVAGAVLAVVVREAGDQLRDAFFFIDAERLAHFGGVLEDHMGPVEENRFLGDRDDETALRSARRFDVALAEAGVGVRHAGGDRADGVGVERLHPRDLFAVELGGDRVDQPRQGEGGRVVGGQKSRVNDLAGDVGERGDVDAVGLGHFVAAAAGRKPGRGRGRDCRTNLEVTKRRFSRRAGERVGLL